MSDYSRAVSDAQTSGAKQHGDKAGARSAPVTGPVALGSFGPTAAPQPALAQDQGVAPSGAADPADEPVNVGPTTPQKPPQGKADGQQGGGRY